MYFSITYSIFYLELMLLRHAITPYAVLLACLLVSGVAGRLQAQHLHTPSQVEYLLDNSTQTYRYDSAATITPPTIPNIQAQRWRAAAFLRRYEVSVYTPPTNPKHLKAVRAAEKQMRKSRYKKAVKYYTKAQAEAPYDPVVMHRLGRAYQLMGDMESARYWYEQSLTTNYADYEIHYLLAGLYREQGDSLLALRHAVKAHLLNRNDSTYLERVRRCAADVGRPYQAWAFEPEYELERGGDSVVYIRYGLPLWRQYAMVKALWAYEPGYAEQMAQVASVSPLMIQEKEALYNVVLGYAELTSATEKAKYPALQALQYATETEQIDRFLYYEITARRRPDVMTDLNPSELDGMAEYVINTHMPLR